MFKPVIQRDPQVSSLVNSVNQQLQNILKTIEPQAIVATNEIKFVSFEEALKELVVSKNLENLKN